MDFGRFRRCSGERALWIMGPWLLAGAVFLGVETFCTHTQRSLARTRAINEVLPSLEERQNQMDAITETLAPIATANLSKPVEGYILAVNEIARTAGVQVISLQTLSAERKQSKNNESDKASSPVLIAAKIDGQLENIISFMLALQERYRLATIQAFSLNIRAGSGIPRYDCEVQIAFYHLNKNKI